jgi:hypothetical protein
MHITILSQKLLEVLIAWLRVKERLGGLVTGRRTYKEEKSEEICGSSSGIFCLTPEVSSLSSEL